MATKRRAVLLGLCLALCAAGVLFLVTNRNGAAPPSEKASAPSKPGAAPPRTRPELSPASRPAGSYPTSWREGDPVPKAPPRGTHAKTPTTVEDVLRPDGKRASEKTLADWALDKGIEDRLRYVALRELEERAPAEAVTTAIALLAGDPGPLLHANAVAVLARSHDPRAKDALSRLDEKSQKLAKKLAR
jgi:hypothetical protein